MKSPSKQAGSGHGHALPYVDMKQEKFLYPDNRRGIRFFLVDSNGKSFLAVMGEERDTRDGHYTYRKQASFTAGPDLVCGNLAGVHKWIKEVMIESGCSEIAIDLKPLRRGSALGGAAEASHHKKQRHLKEEIDRLVSRARELEQSNLSTYTSGIRIGRSSANAWLRDAGTSGAFEKALAGTSKAKASQEVILTNLRSLCDLYAPLQLLDSTNAYAVVSEIEKKQDSVAIKDLCFQIKEVWRLQLQKALVVGASPWDEYPIFSKPIPVVGAPAKASHTAKTGQAAKTSGHSAKVSHSTKSGPSKTGIGKGRKICHHCHQIVGSPSRICPFCKGELPLKTTPKNDK